MSDVKKTNFAIIGAGGIAQAYAQALTETPSAQLAAVVDVRPEAAQAMADAAGAKAYDDVDAMIAAGGVQAAVVSTPPTTHPMVCKKLMDAGIATLCEKPLCVTSEEAHDLIAYAAKSGVPFSMATKFRFVSDVAEAKRRIDAGDIGDVLLFENAFTGRVDMTGRWNSDRKISGGGVLIDNGTHSVDLIRHFLGPIDEVQAIEGKRIQDIAVEDNVTVFVRTADRAIGTIDLSWSLNKELDTYVQIYGTQGAIRLGWKGAWLKRADGADWEKFGNGYNKVESFVNQIEDFSAAVRGEKDPLVSPEDAMASVRVIEAAYHSMRGAGWIKVWPEIAAA